MKLLYSLFLFFNISLLTAQSNNISAFPRVLCVQNNQSVNISSAATGLTCLQLEPGNDFDCIQDGWNPQWYYIHGQLAGALEFFLTANTDVGYVVYGPFDTFQDMNQNSGSLGDSILSPIINCSHTYIDNQLGFIPLVEPNKFYLICIASETNTSYNINFEKTYGFATSHCSQIYNSETYVISGRCFFDQNQNLICDPGEYGVPNQSIQVNPNGQVIYSSPNGFFMTLMDTNIAVSYDIELFPSSNWNVISNNPLSTSLDTNNNIDTTINFPLFPEKLLCQGDIRLVVSDFHCITGGDIFLDFQNTGHIPLHAMVAFIGDYRTVLSNSSEPVTSANGDTLSFWISDIDPLSNQILQLNYNVDDTISPGDSMYVEYLVTYYDTLGNICTSLHLGEWIEVLCSYDPNDKTDYPDGNSNSEFVKKNGYIDYLINFENLGTAQAINIRIEDQISNKLDRYSFEKLSSSHNCRYEISQNGLLKIFFDEINLPHTSYNNKGYFKYRIRLIDSLPPLDSIENTAYIYFDLNEAVVTNTTNSIVECYLKPEPAVIAVFDDRIVTGLDDYGYEFTWFYEGQELINENFSMLDYMGEGDYQVLVKNNFECQDSYIFNMRNHQEENIISIFPNPSNGAFHVNCPISGEKFITIFDMRGQLVFQTNSTSLLIGVDIDDLNSGLYLVNVRSGFGFSEVKRILIQND